MKRGKCTILVLLMLAIVGLGCRTVKVRSAAETKADFGRSRTFNFAEPASDSHPALTAQNRSRIQTAVTEEMIKRDYRVAEKPALLFSVELVTTTRTYDKSNASSDSGSVSESLNKHYGLLYDKKLGSQAVVNYTEGTLLFRAHETEQNKVVWEGAAMGVLYQDRPDEAVQKRIREVVHAVFAKFPAPSKRE